MVDAVVEQFGRIDILVNNAGGYPSEIYDSVEQQAIKIWEWTEAQWDQILKTNLKIPFLCINKVVPVMIKQRSGDIVSVSSRMGRIASQMGGYAVAKAGIVTLTKLPPSRHGSMASRQTLWLLESWIPRDSGLIIIM